MSKLIGPIIVVVLVAVGIWYVARPQKQELGSGAPGQGAVATMPIGQLTGEQVGQTVAIEGVIKTECPTTGCWAVIKDDTGEIRIDTKGGGFSLPLNREGSRVKVVGVVEKTDSGDVQISATSAEL